MKAFGHRLLDIRSNAREVGQRNISANKICRFLRPHMCEPGRSSQGSLGWEFLSLRLDRQSSAKSRSLREGFDVVTEDKRTAGAAQFGCECVVVRFAS